MGRFWQNGCGHRRKSIHIYYGHRHRPDWKVDEWGPAMSENTYIPPQLWRDHADPEVSHEPSVGLVTPTF